MEKDKIISMLDDSGAIQKGHFILSSGLHSDSYVQCALALRYPDIADSFSSELYEMMKNISPDIIVSPAMGGLIIGWEVARKFNKPFIFTERENGFFKLRRGFGIKKNDRVIIVEDVFTTGKSTDEVASVVESYGGVVIAACSIIKRGKLNLRFPCFSLVELSFKTYEAEKCPLCANKIPAVEPGSRNLKKNI
jgi:orotate phosphoribosyltransferase